MALKVKSVQANMRAFCIPRTHAEARWARKPSGNQTGSSRSRGSPGRRLTDTAAPRVSERSNLHSKAESEGGRPRPLPKRPPTYKHICTHHIYMGQRACVQRGWSWTVASQTPAEDQRRSRFFLQCLAYGHNKRSGLSVAGDQSLRRNQFRVDRSEISCV